MIAWLLLKLWATNISTNCSSCVLCKSVDSTVTNEDVYEEVRVTLTQWLCKWECSTWQEIKNLTSVLRRFPIHLASILWLWVPLVSWLDWIWPRGSRRVVWVTRVGLVGIDWISLVRLCRESLRRVSLRRVSRSVGRGVSRSGGTRPCVGGRLLVIHLHAGTEQASWEKTMKKIIITSYYSGSS